MTTPTPGLRFSHIGIYAMDAVKLASFYQDYLGFTQTDHGLLDGPDGPIELVFLSRDPDEHHQIVMASGRPPGLAFNVINQISLKADSLATLQALYRRMLEAPVTDVQPVTHGNAISVYFRDPEGNRLELYVDTPWYVSQPCRVPAPMELPENQLLAWSERHARTLPGFRPRSEWRAEMAEKMAAHQPL